MKRSYASGGTLKLMCSVCGIASREAASGSAGAKADRFGEVALGRQRPVFICLTGPWGFHRCGGRRVRPESNAAFAGPRNGLKAGR